VRRRIFNLAALLSLVLCAAALLALVKSYVTPYSPRGGGGKIARTVFHLELGTVSFGTGYTIINGNLPAYGYMSRYVLNLWPVICVAAVLPLAVALRILFQYHRQRLRSSAHHCLTCNYDLTGNISGVCPECGAACKAADPAGVSPAAGD